MKKICLLFFSWLFWSSGGFGQVDSLQMDSLKVDSSHKATQYDLVIKTMSGEKFHAILTRFTPDSIYMLPFYRINVFAAGSFKIPKEKEEFGIAAENIKRLYIMLDAYIVSEEWLNENKSKITEKGVLLFVVSSVLDLSMNQPYMIPIEMGGLNDFSPWVNNLIRMLGSKVATGTLVLPESGESFIILGKKEKYREMLLELTGLKKREEINKFYQLNY